MISEDHPSFAIRKYVHDVYYSFLELLSKCEQALKDAGVTGDVASYCEEAGKAVAEL